MTDDEQFLFLVFMGWTQRDADTAERTAIDDYVSLGVATAISFTQS